MRDRTLVWWLVGGAVLALVVLNRRKLYSIASDAGDSLMTQVVGWKNVNKGPQWVPLLDSIGRSYSLPDDLLSRVAYQESHFRDDIIRGNIASSAGALGIMQMMPAFFSSVTVPRPFTDADVRSQILEAAAHLAQLHRTTQSWPLTLAAYNAGLGTVQAHGGIPPFVETQRYVAQISADVPGLVA